jgi:pimeloyl-ACP methyl ester carboxylesterase
VASGPEIAAASRAGGQGTAPAYPVPMPERPLTGATPVDPGPYGAVGRSAWLDIDWREHQRWVSVAGSALNVIELGTGDPPVVFIHGLSGSWQNWVENIPHFAQGHRVVAMDLPGFGHSEMPPEQISIPGYGRVVGDLLDQLGIERAVVVGNSMGGFIAVELALQRPALVDRLVLVSSAGLTAEHQRDERALAVMRRTERFLIFWTGWTASRSDQFARRPKLRRALMRFVAHRAEALSGPLIAEQVRGSGKPGFIDALDALTNYPIRDRLGEISRPTLIVWGEEDRLVPVRDAYEFERLIPTSRAVVWPETGHVAMLERPAAFNALVDAFLAESPHVADGPARGAPVSAAPERPAPVAAAPDPEPAAPAAAPGAAAPADPEPGAPEAPVSAA